MNEVDILQRLNHPNILKFKDFFIDKNQKKAILITEYCKGINLFDYIKKKGFLPDWEARHIMKYLL